MFLWLTIWYYQMEKAYQTCENQLSYWVLGIIFIGRFKVWLMHIALFQVTILYNWATNEWTKLETDWTNIIEIRVWGLFTRFPFWAHKPIVWMGGRSTPEEVSSDKVYTFLTNFPATDEIKPIKGHLSMLKWKSATYDNTFLTHANYRVSWTISTFLIRYCRCDIFLRCPTLIHIYIYIYQSDDQFYPLHAELFWGNTKIVFVTFQHSDDGYCWNFSLRNTRTSYPNSHYHGSW